MGGKDETFTVIYASDTSRMNAQDCGKGLSICGRSG